MSHARTTLPPELASHLRQETFVLVVTRGQQIGARYEVGERALLGRDSECTIRLPESGVSRRHVEIRRSRDGSHAIRDLGSMNGVRVNGVPVLKAVLHPGDRIELGQSVELHYLLRDQHERERERDARLKDLGRLAGSVAHDLNNLLSALQANLSVLRIPELPTTEREQATVDMLAALDQGAGLVETLLLFAAQKQAPHEVLDMGVVLGEAVRLIRHRLPDNVECTFSAEPDVLVHGNQGQLVQIPHNLCVNALDAMPNGGHLQLTLASAHVPHDHPLSTRIASGDWALLTIADTGIGMSPQTLARVFEPYFTTRAEGSGIGLATVFGVVQEHGGTIAVASREGEGTVFVG